ncbi:HNH endonuclease [Arthrobacter phage Darby]|uniref:HNH endonuclease n=1 Tax=Arthrobacter phage Darby TaxID=2951390 RepID=A0A9E7NI79_9CAUD|nr:HNH endonuclease [Arthrobacter phage Darby]UTN92074.1 HNH endonuclease [Arthrobacter phage Darby]
MANETQRIELEILSVKSLREDLCVVQSALSMYPSGDQKSRIERIGRIINQLDVMRPLGSDGKHGKRHTENCGCDFPDPTPEQELEYLDRIIAGLPEGTIFRQHPSHEGIADIVFPEGVKLFDVGSLYPTEFFSDWYPITNFDDYEVNSGGQVRNRHNQHILDYEPSSSGKYVKMRNDKGEQLIISVDDILNQVFGI